jgi:hypothetical protein
VQRKETIERVFDDMKEKYVTTGSGGQVVQREIHRSLAFLSSKNIRQTPGFQTEPRSLSAM